MHPSQNDNLGDIVHLISLKSNQQWMIQYQFCIIQSYMSFVQQIFCNEHPNEGYAMEEIYPAVVHANYFQFGSTSRITQPAVQSRMLLWCTEGKGEIVVNQTTYQFAKEDYLLLPWNRCITYKPDRQLPYATGGVHFIPDYSCSVPIQYDVAHSCDSPLYNLPERRDAKLFGCDGVMQGSFAGASSLKYLAEYIIEWFQRGKITDEEARSLGRLLVKELSYASQCCDSARVPARLSALLTHIKNNLSSKISMQDMADFAQCSPPTITRLFQNHMGTSPTQWVLKTRLEKAAYQLTITDLPVGEIGRHVGIDDPYYFSKRFKHTYGQTPTAYRNKVSMLGSYKAKG